MNIAKSEMTAYRATDRSITSTPGHKYTYSEIKIFVKKKGCMVAECKVVSYQASPWLDVA